MSMNTTQVLAVVIAEGSPQLDLTQVVLVVIADPTVTAAGRRRQPCLMG